MFSWFFAVKPELGPGFPPDWLGMPQGIPSGDYLVWQRYREIAKRQFERLYFNVRVGEPLEVSPDFPPEIISMAEAISRRRIDVVGETAAGWKLIELKFIVSAEAFGQILLYKVLWNTDPPDSRPVSLAVVTGRTNRDIVLACIAYDVELIVA